MAWFDHASSFDRLWACSSFISRSTESHTDFLRFLSASSGTWSLRLLESLFGWWEQGINPYDLLGSSSALESADDEKGQQSYSIRALYWEARN